ncbi:hypothetical protein HMPREF1622_04576 [Escherichia coli A35218R]|nr:hypothetical protein HMPREF1622_04576 [Escherichia coli A35218R]
MNALSGLPIRHQCRPDKTRQRRIRHRAPIAGCDIDLNATV